MQKSTGAMLAFLLAAPQPASAASCGGMALDPRFREAMALCADAAGTRGADAPAAAVSYPTQATAEQTATIPEPTTARAVSIAMPGTRRVASTRASRGNARRPNAAPTPLVAAISRKYRINPHLFASMMRQESGGRMDAVSGKGALGLMQVMPATARSVGVADPKAMLTNPVLAMSAGAVYLKQLQAKFGNDVPLVLAAYNAGPGAVMKAGRRIPKYRETQGYVGAIMQRWQRTRQGR
ncbi:MAG: lytic transglycosylase domain-containing protein [Sphingomonas phyllosphaerae]|uniref:lytic transglycosylase domain-containing protein n=1 Tax=Sphingomonas phyllosphaerae TaxID=257003 RepID=UPI002FFBA654